MTDNYDVSVGGDVSGQVAVGHHNQQFQQNTTLTAAERADVVEQLRALIQAEAPPELQAPAAERVEELKEAVATEDTGGIEYLKGWFTKNLPVIAGAVGALLSKL